MAVSSIGYKFTILQGPSTPISWLNGTGADLEIGSGVVVGGYVGILVGGNSQDGSTKVLSTARGSAVFGPPGMTVLGPTSTTEGFAAGDVIYFDLTNQRFTSTAVSAANGGKKCGAAANSKAAGTGTDALVIFNQTAVV